MAEPIVVGNIILDGEAVRDSSGGYFSGRYVNKSQQGWEEHFAGSGKRLPTLAEYVTTIAQLEKTNNPVLSGITQDLRESVLCTGTKIDYNKSNIPVGNGYLDVLVEDHAWETALQDLLQYDAEEAASLLQRISGKRPYIWTPDAERRRSYPERAVWLDFDADRFYLNCGYNPILNLGRARGVRAGEVSRTALLDVMPEPKLLSTPAIKRDNSDYQPSSQSPYSADELEYARGLLDGIRSGTVMDWKTREKRKKR